MCSRWCHSVSLRLQMELSLVTAKDFLSNGVQEKTSKRNVIRASRMFSPRIVGVACTATARTENVRRGLTWNRRQKPSVNPSTPPRSEDGRYLTGQQNWTSTSGLSSKQTAPTVNICLESFSPEEYLVHCRLNILS